MTASFAAATEQRSSGTHGLLLGSETAGQPVPNRRGKQDVAGKITGQMTQDSAVEYYKTSAGAAKRITQGHNYVAARTAA